MLGDSFEILEGSAEAQGPISHQLYRFDVEDRFGGWTGNDSSGIPPGLFAAWEAKLCLLEDSLGFFEDSPHLGNPEPFSLRRLDWISALSGMLQDSLDIIGDCNVIYWRFSAFITRILMDSLKHLDTFVRFCRPVEDSARFSRAARRWLIATEERWGFLRILVDSLTIWVGLRSSFVQLFPFFAVLFCVCCPLLSRLKYLPPRFFDDALGYFDPGRIGARRRGGRGRSTVCPQVGFTFVVDWVQREKHKEVPLRLSSDA